MLRRLVLILALLVAACFAAAVDYSVTLVKGKNTSIVLTTTAVSAQSLAPGLGLLITGTGNISFNVDGVTLGTITGLPFEKLAFDNSPLHMISRGVVLTMPSDQKLSNLFGSGFDLSIKKASTLTVNYDPTTGSGDVQFLGGATVTVPYKDTSGGTVAITVNTFDMSNDGSLKANGSLTLPKAGIELDLVTIKSAAGTNNWGITRPAGGKINFQIGFSPVTANFDVPGLDTLDPSPLTLSVTGLVYGTQQGVSFTKATLAPGTPLKIALPAPVNAELTVSSVSCGMQGNHFQNFSMVSSLTLPNNFSSVDTSSGASPLPVTIPNVSIGFDNSGMPTIQIGPLAHKLDMFFNGFGLHIPSVPNVPPFELDLNKYAAYSDEVDFHGVKYPTSWEGVYIKAATFTLPTSFGAGQEISVKNFGIGSSGISGTVNWVGGANSPLKFQIPGFSSTLNSLLITFKNNQVMAGGASGTINASDWGVSLNASVSFSSTGATTVSVSTNQPIQIPSLGVALQIDQGTVSYDGNGYGKLTLSGSISLGDNPPGGFQSLADASFTVTGLTIDSQGHVAFTSAWLDLPNAQPINVGPLTATINQIGIGQNANNGPWWVGFTGDVGFTGLPISGQLGFNNLTITQGVNGALPSISFPGIDLSVDISGVASIDLDLNHSTYPVAGQTPQQPDWQAYHGPPIDVYSGTANVGLECFGSGGLGFGLNFLGSKDGWFVMGQFDIPPPGIVLGESPFSLFGFVGGFGYNVESDKPGATGVPTIDYNLIPVAPGGPGNDIFVAGVRIGTTDGFTLWGDLTLVLQVGSDFSVDLNGALYVVQPGVTEPMGSVPQDRVITGNIVFQSDTVAGPVFYANAAANMYFPSNDIYNSTKIGAYATGSLWFCLSQAGVQLQVGGYITGANLGTGAGPSIQNPVTVYLMGIQGPAGAINVQIPAPAGVYPIQVAATFSYSNSWSGSWGVFGGNINWNASASVNAWFWGAITLPDGNGNGSFSALAGLGLTGSASFGVSGPFGLNVTASAGFGGVLDATVTTSQASFSGTLDASVNVAGFKQTFPLSFSWPS